MKEKQFDLVFGIHSVLELLRSGKSIDKIFIQNTLRSELTKEIFALAKDQCTPVLRVPVEKLNRITRKNHQGVVAFSAVVDFATLDQVVPYIYEEGKMPLILVLDRITDVRNFGAIARTAECAGVNAILIPDRGAAQVGSDALKTSSGALNYIPICRAANLKDELQYLKDAGLQIVSCTEKTEDDIYSVDFNQPTAIIMGSEENGVSEEYMKLSDVKARIPMTGKVESMNVSVAAGVIVFEAIRQRL